MLHWFELHGQILTGHNVNNVNWTRVVTVNLVLGIVGQWQLALNWYDVWTSSHSVHGDLIHDDYRWDLFFLLFSLERTACSLNFTSDRYFYWVQGALGLLVIYYHVDRHRCILIKGICRKSGLNRRLAIRTKSRAQFSFFKLGNIAINLAIRLA